MLHVQHPIILWSLLYWTKGWCVKKRLSEHHFSLQNDSPYHLASHSATCGCTPGFSNTVVLFKHHHLFTREVSEAFHIKKSRQFCLSQTSVTLHENRACFYWWAYYLIIFSDLTCNAQLFACKLMFPSTKLSVVSAVLRVPSVLLSMSFCALSFFKNGVVQHFAIHIKVFVC